MPFYLSEGTSQHRNKRRTRIIEAFGKKQTLTQWAEEMNINLSTLWYRLDRGWNLSDALTRRVLCR